MQNWQTDEACVDEAACRRLRSFLRCGKPETLALISPNAAWFTVSGAAVPAWCRLMRSIPWLDCDLRLGNAYRSKLNRAVTILTGRRFWTGRAYCHFGVLVGSSLRDIRARASLELVKDGLPGRNITSGVET
ncbi:MAG: hypothetical protein ACM3ZC_02250 [Bacteroidota bacterium]